MNLAAIKKIELSFVTIRHLTKIKIYSQIESYHVIFHPTEIFFDLNDQIFGVQKKMNRVVFPYDFWKKQKSLVISL